MKKYLQKARSPLSLFLQRFVKLFFLFAIILTLFSLYDPGKNSYIPDDLIDFAEKYPEASSFVTAYPLKKDKHPFINLRNEIKPGEIPLFIQWDARWGYEPYGTNLLGVAGCGPTCLSMIVCGLTEYTDMNPLKIARYSEEHGYHIPGAGTSWNLTPSLHDGSTAAPPKKRALFRVLLNRATRIRTLR